MDANLVALIDKIATKLGVTTEHLWGVLTRQAAISGTVTLVTDVVLVAVLVALFKFVQKKTKEPEDGYAEWVGDAGFFAWFGLGVLALLIGIGFCFDAQSIAAAFLNPEFYALQHILKL